LERRAVATLELDVVATYGAVILNPVHCGSASHEQQLAFSREEQNHVSDEVALVIAYDELFCLARREFAEAVDPQ